MNKQEENIVNVLTFDEVEEIVDVFITHVYHADETIALIANKALVEYAMDMLLADDCISVRKVDLEIDDIEYMVSVSGYGEMIVQPVEYYNGKYFKDIKFAYVDMDGCVEQTTIDNLINRDVPVVLFGLDEDGDDVEDETDDEGEFHCEYCRLDKCAYCGNDSKCDDTDDKDVKNKNAYTIDVKCNIDTDEAEKIIAEMERRVEHMHNMFAEMDAFRRIFR